MYGEANMRTLIVVSTEILSAPEARQRGISIRYFVDVAKVGLLLASEN